MIKKVYVTWFCRAMIMAMWAPHWWEYVAGFGHYPCG